MGTFKGTKGKWKVEPQKIKDGYDILANGEQEDFGSRWVASTVHCDKDSETILANAKLIACAPELLLALEMAVMVMPNGHTRTECLDIIKKATE